MKFERTLTPNEVKLLGDNPEQQLHAIIDIALKRMLNMKNPKSVEARIMSLMSDIKSMNSRDIMEAHNAVYGNNPITLAYARFIISGMYQSQLLKRSSRGAYLKGDGS